MRSFSRVAITLACIGVLYFSVPAAQPQTTDRPSPKLAVLIVVDQMRPDYLTRFDHLYTGGFRRLLDSGAVFLNAYHNHAATETAVGHTTISTGRFPSHHGIIGNEYWDRMTNAYVYCMEDTSAHVLGDTSAEGSSPKNIDGPTIGDLLKDASPHSRVIAVALKDRAAIGMAGHTADGAFWYSRRNGNYVTSSHYMSALPAWVDSFNTARQVNSYFAAGWPKLMPDSAYAASDDDSTDWEYDGNDIVFPHGFTKRSTTPDEKYYSALYRSPFSDLTSLSLAEAAVHYEQLGADSAVDLLLVSCSAADAIGHAFGPLSQEAEDYYLRLDRGLGEFFSYLDTAVGSENYVITLCADHAVMLPPEHLQRQGLGAGRLNPDSVEADMKRVGERMVGKYPVSGNPIRSGGTEVILDYSTDNKGEGKSIFQDVVARALMTLPYVADVYCASYLANPNTNPAGEYLQQYGNCYRPDRGPDLFIRFKENYILATHPTATTHGSPYWYDANVPIIFMGPGIGHQRCADRVPTVSIAPTLSALMRISLSPNFDGKPLRQVLGQ